MKFLAWSPPAIRNPDVIPMAWANCDNPDAAAEAKSVAARLKAEPQKVLFFWHPVGDLLSSVLQRDLLAGVPTSERFTAWFETFYAALKAERAAVDLIVCDYEDWVPDWDWSTPLPQLLLAGRNLRTAVLRAVYYPYLYVFGTRTRFLGWASANATNGPVTDRHGWQLPKGDYSYTGASSPALYLDQSGNLFNQRADRGLEPYSHDIAWNCFAQNLNNARACQNSWTAPWISYPSYGNDSNPWRDIPQAMAWLWNEQLKHLTAMGVGQVLYWNPSEELNATPAASELNTTFADDCIRRLPAPLPRSRALRPIAYDADAVTTFGVTTKYKDFVALLSKDGSKVHPTTPATNRLA